MMMMTAKVDIKKLLVILGIVAAVILGILAIFGGSSETAAPVSDNDSRVQFLKDAGWEVSTSPTQSSQVKIPAEPSDVFTRYNALQKSQGYDLEQYASKTVMRYVYKVNNYPDATDPVYATILVYKGKIIGGDITNTSPGGKIQSFQQPET